MEDPHGLEKACYHEAQASLIVHKKQQVCGPSDLRILGVFEGLHIIQWILCTGPDHPVGLHVLVGDLCVVRHGVIFSFPLVLLCIFPLLLSSTFDGRLQLVLIQLHIL